MEVLETEVFRRFFQRFFLLSRDVRYPGAGRLAGQGPFLDRIIYFADGDPLTI